MRLLVLEDAGNFIVWFCFIEVYILNWRNYVAFIESAALIFHKKYYLHRNKIYVLVMSHLISFQFILQFTVIYIFAVSGALGRGLQMTVKIIWRC